MHRLAGHPSWEVVTGFAIDDSSSAPDWRPFMPDVLSARQWIQPGLIFVSGAPRLADRPEAWGASRSSRRCPCRAAVSLMPMQQR